MQLISFLNKKSPNKLSWGIWNKEENTVLDVYLADSSFAQSLRQAIEEGDELYERLSLLLKKDNAQYSFSMEECILQAPYVNPPRNILCTGINYVEHLHELSRTMAVEQKMPEYPFIFTKPCTAIAHPESSVDSHFAITNKYDYEIELAVIIGKKGKNIPLENAMDYVFGYSIINDLSARDLQKRTSQWYTGKCLDESAPFGPCIVCRQSIKDVQNLKLECRINGEIRQKSNTSSMIFNVAKLIHILSQGCTLLPADIIATGTPSGVGMSFKPSKFLRAGDVMELEIEEIGILRNTIGNVY